MSKQRKEGRMPQEKGRNPYDGLRPWSAYTHGFGVVLALVGGVMVTWRAALVGGAARIFSCALYGASMLVLYLASTLYHCVNTTVEGRIYLRKFDHISIYYLIAGTYTPICVLALRNSWGLGLLIAVWVLAAIGTVTTLFWVNRPRWLTAATYLFMGWLAIFALYPISQAMPGEGFWLLIAGGILYTVGAVFYAMKWPRRDHPTFGAHEIFHVFVLLGSLAHFFMIYRVVVYL